MTDAFYDKRIYLGPPGTGKTTTLLGEVEQELAAGTPPEKIAYVSFTRKAAMEAVTRSTFKFGLPASSFPYFRTLHSIAFRMMGFDKSDVFDHLKLPEFGKWAGVKVTGKVNMDEGSTFGNEEGDRCLFLINLARLKQITLREAYLDFYDDIPWRNVEYIAESVEKYKKAHYLVDYTDMLERLAQSSWMPDLEVVIIDEAQDLSPLQWRVVQLLCKKARKVIVAGDDDQAIYQWAGADVNYFIGMPGHRTVLTQSYRIPAKVQEISNMIISRIQVRNEKNWLPREAAGIVDRVDKLAQIDWGAYDDTLVLSRNVKYIDEVRKWLMNQGLNFEFRGKQGLSEEVRTAVKTWQALRSGDAVEAAEAKRVYTYMTVGKQVSRGFKTLPGWKDEDMVSLTDLQEKGGLLTDAPWYVALPKIPKWEHDFIRAAHRRGTRLDEEPTIKLSTIHSIKGGEGKHVIILPDMAGRTAHDAGKDMDSEHRVWYVGVTRTKEKLSIVNPEYKNSYQL